ncbi:hypothetical protein QC761_0091010 [Podospora bellae-mahoneyi]|uniref:Developmental regulatory protein wetA n=1 Tax=Podospora bellae-mahoneyi TaxID=2093777 RepID=A0ABR0F8N2_9PEZI|nr:hypothetical protein QC761_0091010 [Podospora bellae-mahoneyi]
MDALLGGLGLSLGGAQQPKATCGSIFELQDKLRAALQGHVTETRADFIAETFQIRSNAVFEIPVNENENEALENASSINPSLREGVRASVGPTVIGSDGQPARRVNASDAVINQPTDDNAVQKLVASHITTSLGQIDGSQWVVRAVARTDQGWAFSYICKDSWQSWSRQAAKTPAKIVISEWSEKGGQDPIHLSRPAFDCRGCLKISFLKSSRTIEVKYEHSPLHKTVGQLIELLAPPPVAPVVKTPENKPKEPRAPRLRKEPRAPKETKTKTPRSRKRAVGEDGLPVEDSSQPKKRRKKKDSTAPAGRVGDPSERQLYNNEVYGANNAQPNGDHADPAPPVFNLPPGELERRRDVANKLLTDAGIDPQTLSTEQFNIFANQSPDLQKDSLAMLVKYGAERLRIVHPTKDGANSEQSTPSQSPPVQVPASRTPKKRSWKKKSEAELQPEEPVAPVAPIAHVYSGAVEGKKPPRGVCDNCRTHKPPKDSKRDLCVKIVSLKVGCATIPTEYGARSRMSVQRHWLHQVYQSQPPLLFQTMNLKI